MYNEDGGRDDVLVRDELARDDEPALYVDLPADVSKEEIQLDYFDDRKALRLRYTEQQELGVTRGSGAPEDLLSRFSGYRGNQDPRGHGVQDVAHIDVSYEDTWIDVPDDIADALESGDRSVEAEANNGVLTVEFA